MAAETVVASALKKLGDVALKKGLELYEVGDQIEPMQKDLRLFRASLEEADSHQNTNPFAKEWVNQVRELAYTIEQVMDTFLVEIEKTNSEPTSQRPEGNSCCGCFSKLSRVARNPRKLNTFCDELNKIRNEMDRLIARKSQYGFTNNHGSGSAEPVQHPPSLRPTEPEHVKESEVVGFDSAKSTIIDRLQDKSIRKRTVLSIVGVGGLGKTTLAQKVYKSAEVSADFPCRAWVSISPKFDGNKLLREILYSVESSMKEKNPPVAERDLLKMVEIVLSQKRYLIILDDVWTDNLWEALKIALPDKNNASRVIITTRNEDVAMAADRNTKPYKLDYLSEDESLTLLFRKALQRDIQIEPPARDLFEVAKELIKKCGRLPLALVVLGKVLSTKGENYTDWNTVHDTLSWHNNDVEKCTQILRMSYEDLPYDQKKRFKYFAAFPEGHKISAKHIIGMWIAEELIPKDGVGTLEDRARNDLRDLVKRCLLQVVENSWNGYPKYCVMHDLIREMIINVSREENFFAVFSKPEDGRQLAPGRPPVHRATLQFPAEYGIHSTATQSLLGFGEYIPNYKCCTQLKVLVIENVKSWKKDVDWKSLEHLIHLRYLGFRHCEHMPTEFENISFSKFKNLETFDGKETIVRVHQSLWKVPTLRHVIIHRWSSVHCPLKWDDLKNLQTLKYVQLTDCPNLECSVNLRTLGIYNTWQDRLSEEQKEDLGDQHICEEGWKRLEALLSRAEKLVSLSIIEFGGILPFLTVGTRNLPCHKKIQSLLLLGKWARDVCVLNVDMLPTNLTKLSLVDCKLEEDPMPVLGGLQSLRILHLRRAAYIGSKLSCLAQGFPSLEKLELSALERLTTWEITDGAMHILQKVDIIWCPRLRTIPDLQNVIVRRF